MNSKRFRWIIAFTAAFEKFSPKKCACKDRKENDGTVMAAIFKVLLNCIITIVSERGKSEFTQVCFVKRGEELRGEQDVIGSENTVCIVHWGM